MINRRFRAIIIILISILFFIFAFILIKMKMLIVEYNDLIYPGISINEIDLSNLNKEQAMKKVQMSLKEINERRIIKVQVEEKSYETSFEDLKIEENLNEIVELAISYGKKDRFFSKYNYIIDGMDRNFKTYITIDDESYSKFVQPIQKEQNKMPINALIDHDWNGLIITPHELGRSVDVEDLKRSIKETIEASTNEEELIIVSANFITEYPRIMEDDLKKIDSLISTFTTSFPTSGYGRCTNIEIAAKYIDNVVVMPDEEFSFNKTVGATTSGKGYQYAKGIRNGKFVDEIGGGVCQVSSTLYNALLMTGLNITERTNHSKPISYVPLGRDAMISYGVSDLKFINNYKFPILLEAIVQGKEITFNIYSNKEEKEKKYDVITETTKEIKPKREIIYDYGLSEGTSFVEQEGKSGYIISTYRVSYRDGKEKEKIPVGESVYPGKNTVIRLGKKQ